MHDSGEMAVITHETDVLVLGAGASGCGAALAASGKGVRVLLADKGKFGSFAYYCWAVGAVSLIAGILKFVIFA